MTKQELKMILTLIDNYTGEREYSYGCYEKLIDEAGIDLLKEDIKNVFEEDAT